MTRSWLSSLACLALTLISASCATTVVSADPYSGFEGQGDRQLRLYMDRVKIEPGEVIPQVCFECGIPGDGSNQAFFRLPFVATNETNKPWLLTGDMFHLARQEEDWQNLSRDPRVDHSAVLANVAPFSSTRFSVLLSFVGSQGLAENSDLVTTYQLRVAGPEGALLLERRLSVGYFNQLEQFGRFLGSFATGLLVLGAL